ncbi:MAG: ADP-ribosylglycohydrolase family protein [Chromatiaceae bacterium]|nr:ADP-ribosylglycohydrolase family protein [Chromatiaceae bacterium]
MAREAIALDRTPLFNQPVAPKAPTFDFARVEGMLLGLAIGNALGNTTEGLRPEQRRARHGEIRDYLPHPRWREPRGFPSSDTQLSFWTLEQLLADQGFNPATVARRLSSGHLFDAGRTLRHFIQQCQAGQPWWNCGKASASNGALMRIAPLLIPHLRDGGTGLWVDAALGGWLTHQDRASTAACVAFIGILWELLDRDGPPDPAWWLARYVSLARGLEGDTQYVPRGGAYTHYRGPLWRYTQERLLAAAGRNLPVREACQEWQSGAYLLETLPSVLYILMRHGHDPEEALVRAVNDTQDNDTIAAIVGAAVGALHGRRGLPARWITRLSGRIAERDEGRVGELLAAARSVFWH